MRKIGVVTVIATLALGVSVAQAGGGTVKASNYKFAPKALTITKGSKVTWKWVNGRHTVTFVKGSFNKALNKTHPSVSRTFTTPGTYKYYCTLPQEPGDDGQDRRPIASPRAARAGSRGAIVKSGTAKPETGRPGR